MSEPIGKEQETTIGITSGDIVSGDKVVVTYGVNVEDLVATLTAQGVIRTAETAGLQRRTIVALAQRLRPDVLDLDQAVVELTRAIEIALEVIARGERASNEDAFVTAVLSEVAKKILNNDFDGGAKAIADALAEIDRRETVQRETAQRERIALLDAAIKQHTLRRDAVAVAERIERSVAVQHATKRPAWHPDFRARHDEYWEDGEAKGINFSLEVAIECARRMLDTADDAEERGTATILLGIALSRLGEREGGTARLEQAVNTLQEALRERARERMPLQWAMTQNNLGIALWRLGQRENGTARLEQAVNAYRDALRERTRERVPLDWATTQNNLGSALQALGQRESSATRLEESVIAYRAALEELRRERVPLDWATTQNNLGNALQAIGQREDGTAVLEEAVIAYRAALQELTRERVPLDWATTQNNLGNALQALGQREDNAARLEQAVIAYRVAMEELTRERVPIHWAIAQNNLGNALQRLGERESSTAQLEQAVIAYRAALGELTRERVPLHWATAQNNLGSALQKLGQRESSTTRLQEAVVAFQNALEERTRERVPRDWTITQNNLGRAIQALEQDVDGTGNRPAVEVTRDPRLEIEPPQPRRADTLRTSYKNLRRFVGSAVFSAMALGLSVASAATATYAFIGNFDHKLSMSEQITLASVYLVVFILISFIVYVLRSKGVEDVYFKVGKDTEANTIIIVAPDLINTLQVNLTNPASVREAINMLQKSSPATKEK